MGRVTWFLSKTFLRLMVLKITSGRSLSKKLNKNLRNPNKKLGKNRIKSLTTKINLEIWFKLKVKYLYILESSMLPAKRSRKDSKVGKIDPRI